jgi:anti-sigma-K factor RskA
MSDNTNTHALLGPFLLDAVSDSERAEFEAHLDSCEDCQSEVESLRGVIAIMADAEATAPPASLRDRVMAQVDRTSQLPPLPSVPTVRTPDARGSGRASRPLTWARVMTAAAAVVAVVAVGTGLIMTAGDEPDSVAMEREVMMVASAPDAASMDLELGASHLVVSKRMEAVAAMGYGAPMPTKGMEYQLWLVMDDGSAHPGPTFMPTDDGDFMALMHTSFAGVSGFWVTEEPMGGSEAPTGTPLASVEL